MTYIVKTMNDGKVGIYDTERACFPIAGPELREAGITRIEGDERGWFKKANRAKAEEIAATLNEYHGHGEYVESKVTTLKTKAADSEESLRKVGEALIESERAARAS